VITQFPRIQLPSQGQFRPIDRWLVRILPGRAKSPKWRVGFFFAFKGDSLLSRGAGGQRLIAPYI
jgi:hypothetical protein